MWKLSGDRRGFTLIELILTIAILGIVSVPLLSYFSNAAQKNAMAKSEQNAVIAAQDSLEELRYIKSDVTSPAALGVSGWLLQTPADANGAFEVTKACTVNGSSFKVKAKITPVAEVTSGGTVSYEYHEYEKPDMNSEHDLVAAESDENVQDAKAYFYAVSGKVADVSDIDRTIIVRMKKDTVKSGNVVAAVEYLYKYSYSEGGTTHSYQYTSYVANESIAGSKLEDIYIFFRPDTEEDCLELIAEDDLSKLGVSTEQINIYLITQNSISANEPAPTADPSVIVRSASYKFKIQNTTFTGAAQDYTNKVYTNLSCAFNEVQGGILDSKFVKDGTSYTIVKKVEKNRVADINISVYKGDSLAVDNLVWNLDGSKAQK